MRLLPASLTLAVWPLASVAATSGGWLYEVKNGGATILGYSGTGGALNVPDQLGGYPVRDIGNDYTTLLSQIPSLSSVSIPSTVTNIGKLEFGAAPVLSIFVHPDNPKYSSNDEGVLFNKDKTTLVAYPGGRTNSTYNIPNTVTVLGYGSFRGSQKLTTITIPQGISVIGELAFYFSGIRSIEIPSTVTNIGERAFTYIPNLTNISVHPDNPNYKSDEDGVLFSKDKTTLIAYPNKTNSFYSIPNTVTTIGKYAGYHLTYLSNISIPNSVTNIEFNAFASSLNLANVTFGSNVQSIGAYAFVYNSLTSVVIGKSVTNVGLNAFMGCSRLREVVLLGDGPFTSGFLNYVSANIYYLPSAAGWSTYNWQLGNQVGSLNTAPLLPKINFHEIINTNNGFRKTLRFKTYSGINYFIQKSTNLSSWTTQTNLMGGGDEFTYLDESTNQKAFYRVLQQ